MSLAKEKFSRMRSMLLSAGNLEIAKKLGRFDADLNVIDLEDGVPVLEKTMARNVTLETVKVLKHEGLSGALFVRVNAPGSQWIDDELIAFSSSPIDGLVVPMVRTPEEIREVESTLAGLGWSTSIMWGIETGMAVERVEEILDASTNTVAVYFGSEDYATDVGLIRTEGDTEILYARSRIALAAANRGIHSVDKGVTDFRNDDAFVQDARNGRSLGYTGKICVTPRQAQLANQVFVPTIDEIEYSRRLLAAYEIALADGRSAPEIDGHMIDGPLVIRAQKILLAADVEG